MRCQLWVWKKKRVDDTTFFGASTSDKKRTHFCLSYWNNNLAGDSSDIWSMQRNESASQYLLYLCSASKNNFETHFSGKYIPQMYKTWSFIFTVWRKIWHGDFALYLQMYFLVRRWKKINSFHIQATSVLRLTIQTSSQTGRNHASGLYLSTADALKTLFLC